MKGILSVIATIVLAAVAILGPRWLVMDGAGQGDDVPACNVLEHTCQWTHQSNVWEADLRKVGGETGTTEYRLTVKTGGNQPQLLAMLRGESMYMGEYPVPMTRSEVGEGEDRQRWNTRFTPSFCTSDPDMTWRIDLQRDINEKADMPIKLIFKAEGV